MRITLHLITRAKQTVEFDLRKDTMMVLLILIGEAATVTVDFESRFVHMLRGFHALVAWAVTELKESLGLIG